MDRLNGENTTGWNNAAPLLLSRPRYSQHKTFAARSFLSCSILFVSCWVLFFWCELKLHADANIGVPEAPV